MSLAAVAGAEKTPALRVTDLDRTCPACTNFYQFATGGWRKHNPIPAAYSTWGRFDTVQEHNRDVLHGILDTDAADATAAPGSNRQKLGTYYKTCMDQTARDAAGATPLADEFAKIDAISDRASLQAELARLHVLGANALFAFGSSPDAKHASNVIAEIDQAGLGLPDRDYYTKTDKATVTIRGKYRTHVKKMLALAGDDEATAQQRADTIVAFETKLATAQMTRVQLRDPNATYNKITLEKLRTSAPHIDWSGYAEAVGSPRFASLNVSEPVYLRAADAAVANGSLADWKSYLRWRYIDAYARTLSTPFVDEDFDFNSRTLQGTKEQLPLWKRCVSATDNALGEALGEEYVAKAFTPADKARALELVANVQATLREDLGGLPWMSAKTRAYAISKLAAYQKKIGYPGRWRDYSALTIADAAYLANAEAAYEFGWKRDMAKIGKPLDRNEWAMTPPTVNAYYNPSQNEIVFPAGILQYPFFNPDADDAVNYGAIGMVIGHEMTHGFDDQGRQFDAKGNLTDWWTKADAAKFKRRTSCIVNEYSGFQVVPGVHENGSLVQGEAVADLGGLTIAYRAYERSLRGTPHPAPIDGLTAEQRFFLGFAQIWAENDRPEVLRLYAATDPHPAAQFRVNGTVINMPEFARAFACKRGAAMVRPASQRCEIW
ncbi:MAG: M13 family metallopeptidase [Candidatus Velthaea sp.]